MEIENYCCVKYPSTETFIVLFPVRRTRRVRVQRHNRKRRNRHVQPTGNGAESNRPDDGDILGVQRRRQEQIQNDHDTLHASIG